MHIGEQIAAIRKRKGLKGTFVARQLNRTPGWLCNIEKGRRSVSAKELGILADVLGVDANIFFADKLNEMFNCKKPKDVA
jgi:transcriptional regulator with XRE-family HTH domain